MSGFVIGSGPEPRTVRCQDLVYQQNIAVTITAEFEFRISDDDPAFGGVFTRLFVDSE